jgi:hypothetical protein
MCVLPYCAHDLVPARAVKIEGFTRSPLTAENTPLAIWKGICRLVIRALNRALFASIVPLR